MVEKIRANKTARVLAITCIIAFALMLFVVSCKKHEEPQHAPTVVKVIPPTCETMGYTEYTCEHCGIYYADYTDALGHNYGEPCAIGIVRCTERTTYESYCDRCNATRRSSKAAAGHSYAEVSENEIEVTYECQACHEILVLPAEETPEVFVGSEELFDVEPSFTFDVVTTNGHGIDFIRDTLVILDSYFYGTEYEADAIIEYEITENNGSWTISFPEGYEYGTTYVAKLSDGLKFVDYKANELYFGIKNDPDHQNEHQYKDGIVFVRALENASKGYYPLELNTSKNSKYIYLTIGKVDGISKGQTLCVGEVTDVSQINANTVCTMGKVEDIYEISAGKWMVVMSAPEITDVFEGLDVVYTGAIKFDDAELNVAMLGAAVRDAFYESEQFAELLGAVNLSAGRYLADRGYHSYALDSLDAFMSNVRVDPYVSVQDTTLYAKLNGTITLDVRDSSERQTGTLTIAFDAEITSQFIVDAEYKTKKWGFVSLPSVNISIKQNDNVKFNFDVAIDIDGLEDSGYVRNAKTGEVHLACCVEVTRANDPSSFEKITAANANASANKCTHCRPENGANLKNDFNSYYINTIYCSDWEEVVADIKRLTSANTEKEVNVDLKSINIPIGGTPVNIGVDFGVCFGIDIGAIMDYSCEYSQTSVYGMRLNFDDVQVFSQKEKSNFSKNDLAVIGSANVRTGITVQANINIAGLSQCSAGIIADVGAYADISGVRESELGMTGAYLEVGAFYDVDAFYNFFAMSDSLGVDADKYPIQKYGYDKVYFSYDVYRDTLSLGSSYDIAANDLLVVRYYDTKKMQIGKDELSLNEKNKYKVTLSLENGTYCEIKNGKIITKINAPETFTDVLNITVTASNSWGEYKRGSSAYHLGSYTIILEFKLDHVHSWADATCDTPRTCTKCGSKDGSALGHNYTYFSDNNATCTENGTETAICSRCNAVSTRTISGSALGHNYQEYTIHTEATCTENAIEAATCTRCEKVDTRIVYGTMLGHKESNWIIDKEATEAENGSKHKECTICGDIISTASIAATASTGLQYTLNKDNVSYSVSGIGTCTDTNIVIPSTYQGYPVTAIGLNAFKNCKSITDITIPSTVTSIEKSAFYNCSALTSITIPNSITSIQQTVFTGCSRLVNVYYTGDIKDWVNISFNNSSSNPMSYASNVYFNDQLLTDITIPNSVTKIGSYAFYGCDSFTNLTLSDSVTAIGNDAFYRCSNLTNIYYTGSIKSWLNISFNNSLSNPMSYASNLYFNNELITDITIPDSVTSISNYAFYNCSTLTNITIPNSVTSIGDSAFNGCSALTNITIPNFVTSIGNSAFNGCSALTNVTIPNFVTSIGNYAFRGCSALTNITIPNSVTSIGDSAFRGCSALTNITIPNSVTSIGNYTFYDCSALTNITIPNSVTSIGNSAFNGCSALTNVTIPNFVTFIGDDAFRGCSALTNITIPNSVTSIGYYTFYNCSSLANVTIPNSVTSIGGSAFYGCSALTNITIPNSVTSISSSTFYNCYNLTSVIIPDSVTSIGSNAFKGCSGLTNITLSNSMSKIENDIFDGCTSLASITIPKSITNIEESAFGTCKMLSNVYYNGNIEDWVSITFADYQSNPLCFGGNLYINNELVQDIIIPNVITNIGNYAFYGCSSLINVTLPDSLISIGDYAFTYCRYLTNITMGKSITSIGKRAFDSCNNLDNVYYKGDITNWLNIEFKDYRSNPVTYNNLFFNNELVTHIVIPDNVTRISPYAFYGCNSLQSVKIGDSIKQIYNYTFGDCSSLVSVTIGSSVTYINESAFDNCPIIEICNKSSLNINGKMGVGGSNAYCIKRVITDESQSAMKFFDDYVFYDDGINVYLVQVFGDSIIFPIYNDKQPYGIWTYTFLFYDAKGTINLPDYINYIGYGAFLSSSYTEIIMNNSITHIEDYAFTSGKLTSIKFNGTVAQWNAIIKGPVWDYETGEYTIYCTDGKISKDGTVTYN